MTYNAPKFWFHFAVCNWNIRGLRRCLRVGYSDEELVVHFAMPRDLCSSISTGITNVKQFTYMLSVARSECLDDKFPIFLYLMSAGTEMG